MKEHISDILAMATDAGQKILSYYQHNITSTKKIDDTVLTLADMASHRYLVQVLNEITPNIPILSEESSDNHHYDLRKQWSDYWLIDPLDGTKDFIHHNDEFCINIAYIQNHRPLFGMIYSPIKQTHFYAHSQLGAFEQSSGKIQPLVRQTPHIQHNIVVGNYSHNNPKLISYLSQYTDYELHNMGSALKFVYVAKGRYSQYPKFGLCSEWDTAAGVCLLETIGAEVIDTQKLLLCYNKKISLRSPEFVAYYQKSL